MSPDLRQSDQLSWPFTSQETYATRAFLRIRQHALKFPETRASIFHLLAEQLIISEALATRLGQAVAMRNIIVHGYLEVALEQVYHAIQNDLGDIECFCKAIKRYLEGN